MKIPTSNYSPVVGRPTRLQQAVLAAGSVLAGVCLAANSVFAQPLMVFNFNENTGTTVTSADGKLMGTFVGTPTFTNDTPSGLAGDFALQIAAGQRVMVPDPTKVLALDPAKPDFTIQAWVKFTTPTARSVFFYNNGPGGAVSASVFTDRTAYVTTLGVKDQQSAAVIPNDGRWHHMAVVHENGKEFRFYIDGVLADTQAYTGSVIFTRTAQTFFIGAETTGGLQYVGLLDRLRYSKGIVPPDQLDSVATPPLMEFNFNEGTGASVTSADGKLTGTFVGTPTFTNDTPSGLEGDFALQFAAGQRVMVPDPTKVLALDTTSRNFTIQAWVKFVTPTGRSVFFYNNGPGGAVSASVFTDRTAYVTTLGVKDQQSAAVIPDDGKWHHMAVVHENAKEFRFYIDGVLADTQPYTGSVIFTRTAQTFFIGAETTGGLQYVGLLDRLRYSKDIVPPAKLDSKRIPADAKPSGATYPPPTGGWAYIYDGNKDTAGAPDSGYTSLDESWSHDNGSDQWDGSKVGGTLVSGDFGVGNSPGGVGSVTENSVTYLRMQDPGDPRNYGFPDSGAMFSNRKLYFGHDIAAEGAPDTLLDSGATLTFRARIPTPRNSQAPIDQRYPSGATTPVAYPAAGDGYLTSDGGKGNVGIRQMLGGIISFSLTVTNDNFDDSVAGGATANFAGLTMNKLNGTAITAAVNFDSPGEFRGVALDPTQWHEFWITIKADTNGVGTHELSIYLDGSTQPATNLVVTAGDGNDFAGAGCLTIGGSRTVESWALDLDFVAYKIGAEAPSATIPVEPPRFTSIVQQADKVVLTWTGGGTLQSAADVTGIWTDVAGAASPATVTIIDPRRFYRVKK